MSAHSSRRPSFPAPSILACLATAFRGMGSSLWSPLYSTHSPTHQHFPPSPTPRSPSPLPPFTPHPLSHAPLPGLPRPALMVSTLACASSSPMPSTSCPQGGRAPPTAQTGQAQPPPSPQAPCPPPAPPAHPAAISPRFVPPAGSGTFCSTRPTTTRSSARQAKKKAGRTDCAVSLSVLLSASCNSLFLPRRLSPLTTTLAADALRALAGEGRKPPERQQASSTPSSSRNEWNAAMTPRVSVLKSGDGADISPRRSSNGKGRRLR